MRPPINNQHEIAGHMTELLWRWSFSLNNCTPLRHSACNLSEKPRNFIYIFNKSPNQPLLFSFPINTNDSKI